MWFPVWRCWAGLSLFSALQETTLDGERYRHVLCRTGHSNSLQDVLVEDSRLNATVAESPD